MRMILGRGVVGGGDGEFAADCEPAVDLRISQTCNAGCEKKRDEG